MKNHDRAEGQTLLGISMSKDLKARIKQAADKEKRPMANWCAFHLERLLDQMDAEQSGNLQEVRSLDAPVEVKRTSEM